MLHGTARARSVSIFAAIAAPLMLAAGPAAGAAAGLTAPRSAAGVAVGSAPSCLSVAPVAEPVTALPWAQQRYAPQRLEPIADGAGITVAVIDSGVDPRHPQLADRVLAGTDFLDGGDGRTDCHGHGTAVASLIAARPVDGVRFRGLAPAARILPIRVSEQQTIDGGPSGRTVSAAEFARSIRWAVDHGADVINLSVVLYRDDPAVRAAAEYAAARDVVVVAAAGNLHQRGNPSPYPAAYPGVVGVGAIGPDGIRQQFSQTGRYVDLVAPGGEVLAAVPARGHAAQSGTSYAAPFVSATAALVRQRFPDLSAAGVVRRLLATADPAAGGGSGYGSGVVNPYRAVTEAVASGRPDPVTVPAAGSDDPVAAARAHRREQAHWRALWLAGAGLVLAAVVAVGAVVAPRGRRRRWRPADPT